jgi:glucokinase
MDETKSVYIGTDSGATTSKVGGVWDDGTTVSTRLLQRPTNAAAGPDAVVASWVEAITDYLAANGLRWNHVLGVGLAIPGPFQRYGVLDRSANLPSTFTGFDIHTAYSNALAERAGRAVPLTVGNDGDLGGVAEAHRVRGSGGGTVVMLAPGSAVPTWIAAACR